MKSIRFAGVNRAGWDMYRVEHEYGVLTWHLWMNSSGKVSEAFVLDDTSKRNP